MSMSRRHARHLDPRTADRSARRRDAVGVMRADEEFARLEQERARAAEAAALAAEIDAGSARSEADVDWLALRAEHAHALDGLPPIEPVPDPELYTDPVADAAWLRSRLKVWILRTLAERGKLVQTARGLCRADRATWATVLVELTERAGRAGDLQNTLARIARAQLLSLIRARLRVTHCAVLARIARAGRAVAATSATAAH